MNKDIVKLANESGLLKGLNKRIKTKERNIKENKKRYWKLTASERLHYDSRIEKIQDDNSTPLLTFTLLLAKTYFYVLVIFTLFKVLFQVDPTNLVNAFLTIIGMAPFLFKVSILLDIIFFFLGERNKRKGREYLNEKYGFKEV